MGVCKTSLFYICSKFFIRDKVKIQQIRVVLKHTHDYTEVFIQFHISYKNK